VLNVEKKTAKLSLAVFCFSGRLATGGWRLATGKKRRTLGMLISDKEASRGFPSPVASRL